ncbi:MAG: hypothetical protein FJ033_13465 [Chloroflexi bacterium]|nr:hypothetical protein [Chloroflexota bacterium]
MAAYLPAEGIVLMQVAVGRKENELSVALESLRCLDLRGKVVMGDVQHTQRALSIQILDAGADDLWLAKDNQPTLREEISLLFTADDGTVEGGRLRHDCQTFQAGDKGHG